MLGGGGVTGNHERGNRMSALLLLLLVSPPAQSPEGSGAETAFAKLDEAITAHMKTLGAKAATVAVSKNGEILHSKGFGTSDQAGRKACPPGALMRVASVSKPVTSAAIREAVAAGKLAFDDKAFEILAIKEPKNAKVDPELGKITIRHLLDHKGGWDRGSGMDPMFSGARIKSELKLARAVTPADVVRFMNTQPLDFQPGTKAVYSNFGYCVLGRVLEKKMVKPFPGCLEELVFRPNGLTDIKLGTDSVSRRDSREVEYPAEARQFSIELMDANGGLVASAPALCVFMRHFTLNGERRLPGGTVDWTYFGSLPGTTAMARQLPGGLDVAVLINGRRNQSIDADNQALKKAVEAALKATKP